MPRREFVLWEREIVREIAWRGSAVAAVCFEAQVRDSVLDPWRKTSSYYVNDEDAERVIAALRALRP